MPDFRLVADTLNKQHLRGLLHALPVGAVRVQMRDGSVLLGKILQEHQENCVDDAGVWSIAAGVTLDVEGGSVRCVDLLDVASVEAPD